MAYVLLECLHKFSLDPYYEPLPWFMICGNSTAIATICVLHLHVMHADSVSGTTESTGNSIFNAQLDSTGNLIFNAQLDSTGNLIFNAQLNSTGNLIFLGIGNRPCPV